MVHEEVSVRTTEIRVVDTGRKCYEWKDRGLKLEMPGKSTATFNLKIVSSDKFQLPNEVEQLSPVYWVESKGELGGPVELELEHSAEVIQDIQKRGLRFAVCREKDGESSYEFKLCDEGQFINSRGKLEIQLFSIWRVAIVLLRSALGVPQQFLATLYYQRVSPTTCTINFIIVPRQKAWEKVKQERATLRMELLSFNHAHRCC